MLKAKSRLQFYKISAAAAFVAALCFPCLHKVDTTEVSCYKVYINDTYAGLVDEKEQAYGLLADARRAFYSKDLNEKQHQSADVISSLLSGKSFVNSNVNMRYSDTTLRFEEDRSLVGFKTPKQETVDAMTKVMTDGQQKERIWGYTMKIGDYMVNLNSLVEVEAVLWAALDKYDEAGNYRAELIADNSSVLNVLTTRVYNTTEEKQQEVEEQQAFYDASKLMEAGLFASLDEEIADAEIEADNQKKNFEDFELGLIDMDFEDHVQVVGCYLNDKDITELSVALDEITKDQETPQTYEVKSGDTLGEISEMFHMSIEDIVAMNEVLKDDTTMIRAGDEITISVPEPELSVVRQEEKYYEEDYEAEIQYVDNDDWYTNQTQTLQQPSSGHRRVVAVVNYRNNSVVTTDILKQEVDVEAVPKIVERGTKIPPTYIRPVSGGRISSGFGGRKQPKRGASTYHKGLDYAVPIGTAVMASCGGVVTRAGWGSGYGRVIYIQHPDGRETRYGHLSKILVSAGQTVKQGQKIALSGNTGNSTGPHLHFEIRIGGTAVNPVKYLN